MRGAAEARFVLGHPENRHRRIRATGRLAAWWLFRRFGRHPRTFRWHERLRVRWYPDSASAGNAWLCGLLEWRDMRFVRSFLRPGDVFVDVGANIGVYTLLATLCEGVEALAFEPAPTARARLAENLRLNGVDHRVEVFGAALSDHAGEATFTVDRDVWNHVVTDISGEAGTTERVTTRPLDDFLERVGTRQLLIKVDAEGHDLQVLRGARRLLASLRPPVIVEWSNPAPVRALLESLGYRPYAFQVDDGTLVETGWERSGTSNVLAIADLGLVTERVSR